MDIDCTCSIEGSPCPACRKRTNYDQRKPIEQKSKFQRDKEEANLSNPDWVGGLPPVGTVCEGMINYGASTRWRKCEILKHRKEEAAVLVDNPEFLAWCKEFRQIRTPDQVKRDELGETINRGLAKCGWEPDPTDGCIIAVEVLARYNMEPKQ